MGGLVVGPDVGLDLDDPAGAQAAARFLMDEARADEVAGRLESWRRESRPGDGQLLVSDGSGPR